MSFHSLTYQKISRPIFTICMLLLIVGVITLSAPTEVYAAYERPNPTYIAPIPVNIPRPPESEYQGWVAVSDGFNVRVFLTSYVPGSIVIDGGFHTTLDYIDTEDSTIELAMFGPSNPSITVVRWDSDASTFRVAYHDSNAPASWAFDFDTWIKPSYIAYGGCVSFIDDSTSIASFVPVWSDSRQDVDFYDRTLTLLTDSYNSISAIESDIDLIRTYTGNLDEDIVQEIIPSLSSIDSSIDSILLWIEKEGGVYENLYDMNSKLNKLAEISSLLSQLNSNLSSLDGLGDSVDRLNQVVSQLDDSFAQISSDLQALTSVMESEKVIWQQASSDYNYDNFDDDSVSSWDWFSSLLSVFSSSSDLQRDYKDFYYRSGTPDSLGRFVELNYASIFRDFFMRNPPSLPSEYGWDILLAGGLP